MMLIKENCETCVCWFREGESDNGVCRRFPPIPYPMQSRVIGPTGQHIGQISLFPVTVKDNYCQEWRSETRE